MASTAFGLTAQSHDRPLEILVTGVGMVATAAYTSRALAQAPYDLALNLGLCGSFDSTLALGTVVHVVSDRLSELGVEHLGRLLGLDELQLPGESVFVNVAPPVNPALRALPAVHGITVNTVHSQAQSIAAIVDRFAPKVESMEGAAFMQACLISGVAFAQVRAISNYVEPRDRQSWNIPQAIGNLARRACDILEHA